MTQISGSYKLHKFNFMQTYKNILIKAPNWLGDVVLSLPAIKGVRWLWPESHIAVVIKSELADLLKDDHDINEEIPYETGRGLKKIRSTFRLAKRLRHKKFDLVLFFPRSFHSALLGFLSDIPERIGYADEGRGILLTQTLERTEDLLSHHRVYYFMNLLKIFEKDVPFVPPRISIGKETVQWVQQKLKKITRPGTRLIGFNPGAAYGSAKCWLPERYIELGNILVEKFNAQILVFGGEKESKLSARIAKEIINHQGFNLAGQTDVLQLAGLIKYCKLFVTNDTGPMHVATAVGVPVVAIFGPTDQRTTAPYGNNHIVVQEKVDCSPCLERTCPTNHICMESITVADVLNACRSLIK